MSIRRIKNPQVMHPLEETDLLNIEMEWNEESRCWVTCVPELNKLSDYGSSYAEALDNTAKAILLYLEVAEETGERLPLSKRKIRLLRELLSE